jgi:hypothetical protein
MHGHGVNLRHIGLLRSLLLQEIAAACIKGIDNPVDTTLVVGDRNVSVSRSDKAPNVSNDTPPSIATGLPSTDSDSTHISIMDTQSMAADSMDCGHEVGGVDGDCGPDQIPGVFTPALDALQSELLLEALCRTLKVITLHLFSSLFLYSSFFIIIFSTLLLLPFYFLVISSLFFFIIFSPLLSPLSSSHLFFHCFSFSSAAMSNKFSILIMFMCAL